MEHARATSLSGEQARARRIESDAARTRLAFAVFAWLDVRDEAGRTMEQTRDSGVTEGAVKLQKAGLIKYSRGCITVLDRPGLEERSCECYDVVKKEYDRLLPAGLAT